MRENYDRIEVHPVTGALGAEIAGIDLSETLDNETFSEIYDAFLDHLVLFFHNQELTPGQHKAFARRFGDMHVHPLTRSMPGHPEIVEVIKESEEHHNWGDGWHTDLPFLEEPPLGSVLYARDVPPFSGDTHFANMYLAYETLSDTMRGLLDGLKCVFKGGGRELQPVPGHDRGRGRRRLRRHPSRGANPSGHRQKGALSSPQELRFP